MPTPLPPGCLATALCRSGECRGCEPLFANRDAALARQALAPALRDPAAMAALRRFGLAHAGGAALDQLDDQALLALLAGAVAAGRLHLCSGQSEGDPNAPAAEGAKDGKSDVGTAVGPADRGGATPPPAPPAPPRRVADAPPRPTPPPAPPAATPPATPEINQVAQAATLRAAAVSGVPFCEECEKARAARAASAAEPA